MKADRRPYFREYYRENKAQWRGLKWNRTLEQRIEYNARMRRYRNENAEAIKLSRAMEIPLRYARDLVERAKMPVKPHVTGPVTGV